MRIEFVTLFEEQVRRLADFGVVGRAVTSGLIAIGTVDPRAYAEDVHGTVDDRPYGGGPGMVMKVAPLRAAIAEARTRLPAGSPCVFMSPQGRVLDQDLVRELAARPGMVLVAGRYEGPDERVIDLEADYEVSIGDYVLTGGELPAMVLVEAVTRLQPGALGDAKAASRDSFSEGLLDYPQYTRPAEFRGYAAPEVLRSGNHQAVDVWRRRQSLLATAHKRPDLLAGRTLSDNEQDILKKETRE